MKGNVIETVMGAVVLLVAALRDTVGPGFVGRKYLSRGRGGWGTVPPRGGRMKSAKPSVALETLTGQMICSSPGAKRGGDGEAPADQQGQPQAHPSAPA